tara:strand:+ start:977 stop:1996 length:1020 start_codon:yes stop_codon:yes gene_type:complete
MRPLEKKLNFFNLILRIVRIIIELRFLFIKNRFYNERITKKNLSKITGLCFTKSKPREVEYLKNIAGKLIIDDIKFRSDKTCFCFKRCKYIFKTTLKLKLYSIKEIALIYDFFEKIDNNNLFKNYNFYIAIDGITPINRLIALIAKRSNIKRVKIISRISSSNTKDSNFDTTLILESFVTNENLKNIDGCVRMKSNLKSKNEKSDMVGFIAAPLVTPPYISFEAIKKLKTLSQKNQVIIRNHPQFYKLPLVLVHLFIFKFILYIYQIKYQRFSNGPLDDFLNEINCLYTDYDSLVNKLALRKSIKVIYLKGCEEKIINPKYKYKNHFKQKLHILEYYLK